MIKGLLTLTFIAKGRVMNTENKSKNSGGLVMFWVVVVIVVGVLFVGGCAYNRATEDGALARFGFNLEILPSGSSDDTIALSNKAVETTENSSATNAHDSGIKKTEALTKVTTTTTVGPGQHNVFWAPNRNHIRN